VSKLEISTSSEIDVRDLPDATGGRMVPFIEVFPFCLALYFPMQDEIGLLMRCTVFSPTAIARKRFSRF